MNEKFIQNLDKLPADVRRQFALLANQYGEKKKKSTIKNDFLSFVKNYHFADINLFWKDIEQNAVNRVKSWHQKNKADAR